MVRWIMKQKIRKFKVNYVKTIIWLVMGSLALIAIIAYLVYIAYSMLNYKAVG